MGEEYIYQNIISIRIGIVVNIDTVTLLPYLTEPADKELVNKYCSPNGAPAVNTLILSFLKHGHFLRIFTNAKKTFNIKTPQVEIYAIETYNKYPIKYLWGGFITAERLKNLMCDKLDDLDTLHAHWTYEYAYAASFYEKKLPVFCTIRDYAAYIWKIESWKNKISRIFKQIMNDVVIKHKHMHFIANSPYTAHIAKNIYKKDIPIIPNSIKDSFIKQGEHIYPKEFTLVCISSSNDKRKNIISLLKAFKLFRHKHQIGTLQLIGSPFIAEDSLIKRWKEKELLDNVELIGRLPHNDIISYLDNCSIFITPSLEETFGNTLLESIVRKVPTIGGINSGAVPYVLHHGEAGFLCDVSKPECIFQTIEDLFLNPQKAQEKAEKGYKIIISEYSESIVCQKHIDLYKTYL